MGWVQAARYGNPKATTLQIPLSAIAGINKVYDIIAKRGVCLAPSFECCDSTHSDSDLEKMGFVTVTRLLSNQVILKSSLFFDIEQCYYRAFAINHTCTVMY